MKRLLWIAFTAWAVLGLTWWVFDRLLMTDEKRVLRQVEVLRKAAELGKTLTLADAVANDYQDDFGLDKRTLLGVFSEMRREHPDLRLIVERAVARVQGDQAEANVRGRAVSKMEIIESGDFKLTFGKQNGHYKLKSLSGVRNKE